MKTRHHYVPQFLLRGFAIPKQTTHIWRYTKDNKEPISISIKDASLISHYYSFTMPDGSRNSELIESLFQKIEHDSACIVRKIEERKALSQDERVSFSLFIAFQLTRVPAFRENTLEIHSRLMKSAMKFSASNKQSFDLAIKSMCERLGIEFPSENFRKLCLSQGYEIEYPIETSLEYVVRLGIDLAPIINQMNWGFLHSSDLSYWVVSDNPVFLADPSRNPNSPLGIGFNHPNIELTLPLTKQICFIGSWQNSPNGHLKLSDKDYVWEINRRTIISAKEYIFSPHKHDLIRDIISKSTGKFNIKI